MSPSPGAGPSGRARRRLPRLLRVMRARPRLFICIALGLAVVVLLPHDWRWATRFLTGWDAGCLGYLVTIVTIMLGADPANIRRRAVMMDEGRFAILILTATGAIASLGAIVVELGDKENAHNPRHLALAVGTIALSWALTHTIFALHYAHEYYAEKRHADGGLAFPGKDEPDYWDFLYFSLVIGMTSQVSDVAVTSKGLRRIVAAHGVVSFFFNATLLALMVNIAASALSA
jgi:uncharacterized membrane protein